MITPWYIGYLINLYGVDRINVLDTLIVTEMLAGNEAYDEVNRRTTTNGKAKRNKTA